MGLYLDKFKFKCQVCLYVYKFDKDKLLDNGSNDYVDQVQNNNLRECVECYYLTPDQKISLHNKNHHEFIIEQNKQRQAYANSQQHYQPIPFPIQFRPFSPIPW